MKSLNQIYKNSGTKSSYKEWLTEGLAIFNQQKDAGMFPKEATFEVWANAVDLNRTPEVLSDDATPSSGINWSGVFDTVTKVVTAATPIVTSIINKPKSTSTTTPTGGTTGGTTTGGTNPLTTGGYAKTNTILGMSTGMFIGVVFGITALGVGIYLIAKS